MQQCDATASPSNESPSEAGDSDGYQNFPLSDDSYGDNFDNNICLFDQINISTLNEPQNADLTTGKKQEA